MCVCLSTSKGINNKSCHNWIKQFTAFLFAYMTLAINKLNGHGLSNTTRHEHLTLADKEDQGDAVLNY